MGSRVRVQGSMKAISELWLQATRRRGSVFAVGPVFDSGCQVFWPKVYQTLNEKTYLFLGFVIMVSFI